jgi:hypothetical protein
MNLNQTVAVEKQMKARVTAATTTLHRLANSKSVHGQSRAYKPEDDDGNQLPPEHEKVQVRVEDVIHSFAQEFTRLFDITATKDLANCSAHADVVMNGTVLAKDVPATTLLFLEKNIANWRKFLDDLPTLDPKTDWTQDTNDQLWKNVPEATQRFEKHQKPMVLHEGTENHPPQVQLVVENVHVGTWWTSRHSGALPMSVKAALLKRCEELHTAVVVARQEANKIEAPTVNVAAGLFAHLLSPLN